MMLTQTLHEQFKNFSVRKRTLIEFDWIAVCFFKLEYWIDMENCYMFTVESLKPFCVKNL